MVHIHILVSFDSLYWYSIILFWLGIFSWIYHKECIIVFSKHRIVCLLFKHEFHTIVSHINSWFLYNSPSEFINIILWWAHIYINKYLFHCYVSLPPQLSTWPLLLLTVLKINRFVNYPRTGCCMILIFCMQKLSSLVTNSAYYLASYK